MTEKMATALVHWRRLLPHLFLLYYRAEESVELFRFSPTDENLESARKCVKDELEFLEIVAQHRRSQND